MAKAKVNSKLNKIFAVDVALDYGAEGTKTKVLFNIDSMEAPEVSFDGGMTWQNAEVVYHAMKEFENRFPTAFGDPE